MTQRNEEYYRQRLSKLERLRSAGVDPYPARFKRTHTAQEATARFEQLHGDTPGAHGEEEVTAAGRLTAQRIMGKASFMDLNDGSGKLQLYFRSDHLSPEQYEALEHLDLGDFLGATGTLFRTRTGQISLEVHSYTVLAKALQPPPEKWHGLTDVETRYRHRYLDLMSSEEVRATFVARARLVAAMRRFLNDRGFIEVETPVLLPHAGGAAARPFATHHNALDQDFFLRVATELHLKRLIVGGYEKVYEIGRIFRNEGISTKHNPEFSTMECYEAYADYQDMMALVEQMTAFMAQETLGALELPFKEQTISLAPPWQRYTFEEVLREHTGISFLDYPDAASLYQAVKEKGLRVPPGLGYGKLVDELFSEYAESHLIQPTFLLDYPIELSPLAKQKAADPRLVERFEGFIGGMEIANAFSELNDPEEQRRRFGQQADARAEGDEEAELPDEDFLFALEHGMPPTGGLGMGIDRLAMIFTNNASIREVILFPQLRSKE